MPRFSMLVSTNPVPGKEEEYNRWYDGRHLPDVLRLDGFVAAQRFRLADAEPAQDAPHRYLAIYEVEAESVEAAGKVLTDGFASGALPMNDALDLSSLTLLYYEPITDRRTSEGGQ
jgi:hypothetical protein